MPLEQWVMFLPLLVPAAPLVGWLVIKIIGWVWELIWNI